VPLVQCVPDPHRRERRPRPLLPEHLFDVVIPVEDDQRHGFGRTVEIQGRPQRLPGVALLNGVEFVPYEMGLVVADGIWAVSPCHDEMTQRDLDQILIVELLPQRRLEFAECLGERSRQPAQRTRVRGELRQRQPVNCLGPFQQRSETAEQVMRRTAPLGDFRPEHQAVHGRIEATGTLPQAVEFDHDDGFMASRDRPHAKVVTQRVIGQPRGHDR
jgi:hypothetical protein